MDEYIERKVAIRTAVEAVDAGLDTTSGDLAEILDDIPAADVAPVRHGRWQTLTGDPTPRCTACHKETVKLWHGGWYTPDHCPNCGAKMDGGKRMDEYVSKTKLIERAKRSWLYFSIVGLVQEIPVEDVEPAEELALLEAKNEVLGQENDRLKAENKRLHKENFWLTVHEEKRG